MKTTSNINYSIIISLGVLLLMSGCATMNKDECLNSDWRLIGYEDGVGGHDMLRIAEHRKACAKHNVTPDAKSYGEGRDEGLEVFCQTGNAYQFGLRGGEYKGVCPKALEDSFVSAYDVGHKIYVTKSRLSKNKSNIMSMERTLKQNKKEMIEKETLSVQAATTEERAKNLAAVKELAKEQQKLESEIYTLKGENKELEKKLFIQENRNPYR